MPAGSDPAPGVPELPRSWRPFGVRMAGAIFGGALVVVLVATALALPPEIRALFTWFELVTMAVLAVLAAAAFHALTRSRVDADEEGLTIVNGYRRRRFSWPEVIAVRLPAGAPWASLDLADGTTCSVLGIQGSDGRRAQTAVAELRLLLDR